MANPEHTPEMSSLDNMTVALYRTGLTIAAVTALIYSIERIIGVQILGVFYLPVFAAGIALASADVHLYDPKFRWFFPFVSWIGFVILAFAYTLKGMSPLAETLANLSLGFFYVGAGMFALKESFCFRIIGLPLVPLFLCGSVLNRLLGFPSAEPYFLLPAALLLTWLVIAKWRMPLHFDIGDKSMYGF
ncbi:putative integral membrane protein [Candidatus Electrothrix aarhusensis]|uniref:Putative integral membrane protein n=1 Tax=Candidatus Electrothrix aarhusensis TaxID=1859131 RepID=A0A3S3SN25_9BACT|nr:putative integral membrane protein [Candidatus Electrothrix aarhusensis]